MWVLPILHLHYVVYVFYSCKQMLFRIHVCRLIQKPTL